MAINILAFACLVAQFAACGASSQQCDADRCTIVEVPPLEVNQRALFQKNVGKHRVTLADVTDAGNTANQSNNSIGEVTPQVVPAVETSSADVSASSSLPTNNAADTGIPATATIQVGEVKREQTVTAKVDSESTANAHSESESVALTEEATSSTAEGHEMRSSGLLYLASSLGTFIKDIAESIRQCLPESVVYFFPALRTDIGAVFGLSLFSGIVWCSFVAVFAWFYRSQKAFPQAISSRPEQDFNDWTSSPFDVCMDMNVCCWSCWCPCIRWADNMDMLGIMSFWVGLMVFCGLILLISVPGGLLLWLIAALLWMSFRQQFRLKFDMEQNTLKTFLSDCAIYCCCWSCAIAQEARHIEEACRAAHKAVRKFEAS